MASSQMFLITNVDFSESFRSVFEDFEMIHSHYFLSSFNGTLNYLQYQQNYLIQSMETFLSFLTHSTQRINDGIQTSITEFHQNFQQQCQQKSLLKFISHSADTISSKMNKDLSDLSRKFESWNPPPESRRHKTENDSYLQQENHAFNSSKVSRVGNHNSRISEIQSEKKAILRQIRLLNDEIADIKSEQKAYSQTKRRESLQSEEQASEAAKKLVNHYKKQKKEREMKRRHQTQKMLEILKEEEELFRNQVFEQQKKMKDNKRRQISIRIEDTKKKRQQRQIIDKESNKLVSELKKQHQILQQRQSLPQQIIELQQKKMSIYQKKQEIDFREIEEHQRKYLANKLKKDQKKRGLSTGHTGPKFIKNVWASLLEDEEKKKKEYEKQKQKEPQKNLDRRLKYGELVKSIFVVPKGRQRLTTNREDEEKTESNKTDFNNGGLLTLPKISESEKAINQTKIVKKFREKCRFETSPGHFKSYHQQKSFEKSPQEKQKQKIREVRLLALKKQTDQRLRRIDTQIHQVRTPEKAPKNRYKNYLGTMKLKMKKQRPKEWKKIIENTSLTEEQKRIKMLKHAESLEQEAKRKQQTRSEAVDQQSIDLYINSIQAKLALLQNF